MSGRQGNLKGRASDVRDGVEERGVFRRPAEGAQAGVADAFVGPAALAVEVDWSGRRQRALKPLGEAGVELALHQRAVVVDVEDSVGAGGHEGLDGALDG